MQAAAAGPKTRWITAWLAVVGVCGLLLVPVPVTGRVPEALLNLLHAPVFAALTIVMARALAGRGPRVGWLGALAAAALAFGIGLGMEFAQSLVDRQTDWHDVWANALGALAGVLWIAPAGNAARAGKHNWRSLAVLLLAGAVWPQAAIIADAALQQRAMPLVGSFETSAELSRWAGYDCRIARVREHATDGAWSLCVELPVDEYPGAALRWPVGDWSGFGRLSFDVTLDEEVPLDLVVKVQDAAHNGTYEDRFHQVVHVEPGTRQFTIDLADVAAGPVGRRLDLERVTLLQFFVVRPRTPRTFYLDNIRLWE